MKAKAWLTVFSVIALLVIGAAGFFCFTASQAYSTARASWDDNVGTITSLGKKPLFPKQENVEALEEKKEEYEKAVADLFAGLNQFQKPLNKTLGNTEFGAEVVKTKVNEFRALAQSKNFEIPDENFQLGFDAYANSVPSPEIVPILDYELNAIEHILQELIASGGESLNSFTRDLIPGEVGGPEQQDSGVVHKYPVRLGFRANHSAFQKFVNSLSNDNGYFYIIRVLKVSNEVSEGPLKGGGVEQNLGGLPKFEHPTTRQIADQDMLTKWGFPEVFGAALEAKAKEDGFISSQKDARVLMGLEKLDVFMVIDIIRFLDPSDVGSETARNRSN